MPTLKKIENEREYLYDPDSRIIYYRFWYDKQRYTRSTGVKASEIPPQAADIRKAIAEARKVYTEFSQGKKKLRRSARSSLLIGPLFEEYLADSKPFMSADYYADVKSRWNKHLRKFFVEQVGVNEEDKRVWDVRFIDNNAWKKYVSWFWSRNPGKQTKHHLTYLKTFLHWVHSKKDPRTGKSLLPALPDLELLDEPKESPGRALSDSQVDDMIAACENDSERLQIMLYFLCGMRGGKEVLHLKREWCVIQEGVAEIQIPAASHKTGRKTRRARNISLHPRAIPVLATVLAQTDGQDWLFPSKRRKGRPMDKGGNRKMFNRILKHAEIEGRVRRHDGRVTTATRFAENGVSRTMAKEALSMTDGPLDRSYTKVSAKARASIYDQVERSQIQNKNNEKLKDRRVRSTKGVQK